MLPSKEISSQNNQIITEISEKKIEPKRNNNKSKKSGKR